MLRGPRRPVWACACGSGGNWASRLECRGCGRAAPVRIAAAARAAHKAALSELEEGDLGARASPRAQRARAKAPPKPEAKAATRGRQGCGGGTLTFAEVVARSFPQVVAAPPPEEEEEVEECEESEVELISEEPSAQELRYWRDRRALALRAGPCGAADAAECGAHIAELEARARAARPWSVRVQAAGDAHRAAEARFTEAAADLGAAKLAVQHLAALEVEARAAMTAAAAALEAVRAEGAPPPTAAPGLDAGRQVAEALVLLRSVAAGTGQSIEDFLRAALTGAGGSAAAPASTAGSGPAEAGLAGAASAPVVPAPHAAPVNPVARVALLAPAATKAAPPQREGRRSRSPALRSQEPEAMSDDSPGPLAPALTQAEVASGRQRVLVTLPRAGGAPPPQPSAAGG